MVANFRRSKKFNFKSTLIYNIQIRMQFHQLSFVHTLDDKSLNLDLIEKFQA